MLQGNHHNSYLKGQAGVRCTFLNCDKAGRKKQGLPSRQECICQRSCYPRRTKPGKLRKNLRSFGLHQLAFVKGQFLYIFCRAALQQHHAPNHRRRGRTQCLAVCRTNYKQPRKSPDRKCLYRANLHLLWQLIKLNHHRRLNLLFALYRFAAPLLSILFFFSANTLVLYQIPKTVGIR